jgi:outer membrane protein
VGCPARTIGVIVWSLLWIWGLLGLGSVRAEDLRDLYAQALSNDPTFQSARFSLETARKLRPEAFAALMPSVSATGSGSRLFGKTQYTGTPLVDRSFDSDQWTLQLTQPIISTNAVLGYDEAKSSIQQAIAQFAAAEQDLVLRLARAYFDEVVAERHVMTTRAQVTALAEQLGAARHSYASGVASVTDVDDTESRYALAQAQETAAGNDVESARAALEAITGSAPGPLNILKPDAPLPRPSGEVSAWVERASAVNPLVKAAEAGMDVAQFEVYRNQLQYVPTVSLVANYGGNYSSGNITEPENFGTNVRDRQVSVQISVPLFDGGAIQARIGEARAKRSKAQADLTGAQRQAVLNARQSYAAVVSGISQVHALQTAVGSGQNAVKGNKVGYSVGVRINSDVLNAEQQLFSSMQDLEKARYDTLYGGLELKAAAGELSAEDLQAINSLLMPPPAIASPNDSKP